MEYGIDDTFVDNGLTKHRHWRLIRDEYGLREAESAVVFHEVLQIKRAVLWNPNHR